MKPGNFILDLLRTYRDRGTSAKNIMQAAAMFDVSENLVRVTLSRLVSRGLIEKVSRGHYRLADSSDSVSEFVEEWRLGEKRCRDWQTDHFVLVHAASLDSRSEWVLRATGFRPIQRGADQGTAGQDSIQSTPWCRPDNLKRSGIELHRFLEALGLCEQCLFVPEAQLLDNDVRIVRQQYDVDQLDAGYRQMIDRIRASAARLEKLPVAAAMKESFALGGEAIQILAKDPMLPAAWHKAPDRTALWQAMINYDELGRSIWAGRPATLPAAVNDYR